MKITINDNIKNYYENELCFNVDNTKKRFQCIININDDVNIYNNNTLIDFIPFIKENSSHFIDINVFFSGTLKIISKHKFNCSSILFLNNYYPLNYSLNKIITCKIKKPIITQKNCIYFVLNRNYFYYFKNMFNSVRKNININNTIFAVFLIDFDERIIQFCKQNNITIIYCDLLQPIYGTSLKLIGYQIADYILASKYMYIDCDMLIYDNLDCLFDNLDYFEDNVIAAVKQIPLKPNFTFEDSILYGNYKGNQKDISEMKLTNNNLKYKELINSGFFVMTNKFLFSIKHLINKFMPYIIEWEKQYNICNIREEAILIAVLSEKNNCILLNNTYNFQLDNNEKIKISQNKLLYDSKTIKIAHFNGYTKKTLYEDCLKLIN